MKFMISYEMNCEQRSTSGQRFLDTGGGPPKGIQMLARWHRAAGLGGWVIAETNSAEAIATWVYQWNDLLRFEIHPILDDEQTARVLSKALK